ncbi:Putative Amino acid transporter (Eurofung) [Aspergillus calidoustus]|jgi:amino acid transporter|uniref:Putative Amino acid transporter (Eurofung) n=1 Tax=Aspergillus calidoustus TaxID=454130 RepID=A0A0U5G3X9_ASPCI|nr:Putative Amino acid transporter (Eurofung) [Aspergillus calidoustus]
MVKSVQEKAPSPATATVPADHEVGQVVEYGERDHGADSGLVRALETRHLLMFSIGSSIGMGLWLGSGTSLASGGPAAIFLGYWIAGSIAWLLNQAVGELAVLYPVPSAFPQWTLKFVDRALALTVGWSYWFSGSITLANELQAIVTVLQFWDHKVPVAAWLSIFLVLILLINICAVRVFGEAEAVMSTVKLLWIVIVIIAGIVISAGGGPNHKTTGFEYWNSIPFTHGFKGFLSVMGTCIFAMSGSEMAGLVAAEARNPLKAVPQAVNSIWIRLSLFYILGALIVSITVSPENPNLFGGAGVNASPFVIAFRDAGIPGLAHAMNAVIFISVFSCGNAQAYAATRTLVGLAEIGMAPSFFQKCDKQGRPWYAVGATFLIGGGLCYLNVSNSGATVFGWFSSLTSLCTLYVWGMVFVCHIRLRAAWKAQGRSVSELPWKTWTWPWGSIYGLGWCIILVVVEFYLAVWPLGEASSAETFFANYVSMVAILVLYILAKLYYRGPFWVTASNIDLDTGRRYYVEDIDALKKKTVMNKVVDFFTGDGSV